MKNVTYFFILFLLTLTTPLFADKNSNEDLLKTCCKRLAV